MSLRSWRIEEAAKELLADVRRRYPGEALRCPFMIALDNACREPLAGQAPTSEERCPDCGREKWRHTPVEDFPCGARTEDEKDLAYVATCEGGSGGPCTQPDCEKCWPDESEDDELPPHIERAIAAEGGQGG